MNTQHATIDLTRTQAACLIAAPAVLMVGRALITPFRDKGETAGYLSDIAANHATSNAGAVAAIAGALLLVPAFIGLGRIATPGMPKLAWLGTGLAVVGSAAIIIVSTLSLVGAQIAQFAPPDGRAELFNKIFNSGPGSVVGQFMLVCGVAGCIMLAVGLYRSGVVSRAAAVLVGIGGATTMITAAGPVRFVLIAAATVALVAFAWTLASLCVDDSTRHDDVDRTLDSSNARSLDGTPGEHDTPTGHDEPDHLSPPAVQLANGIGAGPDVSERDGGRVSE